MKIGKNIVAYIDGANLYRGIERLGWVMDYRRFRIWLKEKYNVHIAYLFIGLIPRYKYLYKHLQECGYTLVFKEVIYDDNGKPKGNCDADMVLQAVSDAYEGKCDTLVIVTSDGDYAGLVKFLIGKGSSLGLKPLKKKKPPIETKLHKGLFRRNIIIVPEAENMSRKKLLYTMLEHTGTIYDAKKQ